VSGGGAKRGRKSNVRGIPFFLILFIVFLLFWKMPKGTPNLRKNEGKGKASYTFAFSCRLTHKLFKLSFSSQTKQQRVTDS